VQNLAKEFNGLKAVDGLCFGVRAGSITAMIGPNGAGKSTALKAVCGLVSPPGMVLAFTLI